MFPFLPLIIGCYSKAEPLTIESQNLRPNQIKYIHNLDSTVVLFLQEDMIELPQLLLKESDADAYNAIPKLNTAAFLVDSNQMELTDSTIILRTSSSILSYPKRFENENYIYERGFYWLEYKGFHENLKLYHTEEWWNGEFTLGRTLLIDSLNNIGYTLESQTDGIIDLLSISPENRFIICISHDIFDDEVNLQLISISAASNKIRLHNHSSGFLSGQIIEEICWVNEFEFAIKARVIDSSSLLKYSSITIIH